MKIASNWKLRFDPAGDNIVILDFGQYVDQEFPWKLAMNCDVVPIVDGAAPFLRKGGNAVVTLEFKTYSALAYDKYARRDMMRSLMDIAALGKKPLRVEVYDLPDRYWQFAQCVISTAAPRREVEATKARWEQSYSIVATNLTQTGP